MYSRDWEKDGEVTVRRHEYNTNILHLIDEGEIPELFIILIMGPKCG